MAGPNGRIVFGREDFAHDLTIVYTANPDGSHVKRLLPTGIGAGSPHWSPDGSRIAVGSALDTPCCDIFPYSAVIVNLDTGAYRTLPMQSQRVVTFCTIWSPNARRLACEGFSDNDSSVNGVYTIRSSNGGGPKRVTNAHGGDDIPIDYSPNGTQILYGHTLGEDDRHAALWVVNVDGSHKHQVTPVAQRQEDHLPPRHQDQQRNLPRGHRHSQHRRHQRPVTNSPSVDHQTDWGPHPLIR